VVFWNEFNVVLEDFIRVGRLLGKSIVEVKSTNRQLAAVALSTTPIILDFYVK
jgi:hypothetical protein